MGARAADSETRAVPVPSCPAPPTAPPAARRSRVPSASGRPDGGDVGTHAGGGATPGEARRHGASSMTAGESGGKGAVSGAGGEAHGGAAGKTRKNLKLFVMHHAHATLRSRLPSPRRVPCAHPVCLLTMTR